VLADECAHICHVLALNCAVVSGSGSSPGSYERKRRHVSVLH